MNEAAGQLLREAARDFLQFVFGVIARVDLERALGTAKRNEHDGALVGHESGECLDFVLIGKIGVADACFTGNMLAVYSAPTGEYFVAVVQLDAELELVAGVAASNLVGRPGGRLIAFMALSNMRSTLSRKVSSLDGFMVDKVIRVDKMCNFSPAYGGLVGL